MRIGIDGRRLGLRPKGIGRYIWELCNGLDEVLPNAQFFLYTPRSLNLPRISNRWSFRVDESPFGRLPSNLWLVVGAGRLAQRDEVDCFWSGSGLLPLVGVRARTVLTIHDLVHKVAPETMDTRALWATRLFFQLSVANANALVTNSEGTARRLEKYFGYQVAAIVRPGLSRLFELKLEYEIQQILADYTLTKPYLLAVATWEPRKGLELLIKTFLNMKAVGLVRDHKLVLVGERGWKYAAIADLIRRNSDAIVSLGFVNDVALAGLYRGAEAFVFPSKYEGFGMPVLEARACGAAVITSDLPELREAGGEAGIYIEPTEEGIRNGILTASKRRPAQGLNWRDWSWSESAAILAQVLLGPTSRGSCLARHHAAVSLTH
ncbi:MAG: glycosyltransferase family 1 protein [Candidatus Binataceae bacterium]